MNDLTLLIPIIAIVGGLSIAAWAIYLEHKKTQLQHEERRLMIEKGLEPPDLEEKKPTRPEDWLRRGIILFFLGLGLGLAAWFTGSGGPGWLLSLGGLIVGFLGLGYLVYYFVVRNQSGDAGAV